MVIVSDGDAPERIAANQSLAAKPFQSSERSQGAKELIPRTFVHCIAVIL